MNIPSLMSPNFSRLVMVAAGLAFLAPLASTGQDGGERRPLFQRTDSEPAPLGGPESSEPEDILSRSTIRVDWEVLREVREHGSGTLGLDAGERGELTAIVSRVAANLGGGYSLSGSLAGYPESRFVATVHGDALVASVSKGGEEGGDFEIIVNPAGRQEIREVDNSTMPTCGVPPTPAAVAGGGYGGSAPRPESASSEEIAAAAEETTVIDVMVVYTALAREVAGGVDAMIASIHHAVENANLTFIASGVSVLYRLVHSQEVDFDELNYSIESALIKLSNSPDGQMDEVHGLRDTYGADIVSLWTGIDYGGWAFEMTNVSPGFESLAFNVCGASYTRTLFKLNYLFSHECGHNLGCGHDLASTPFGSGSAFPYSYGWRWFGNDGVEYRTIMSYAPGAIVYQFSNPGILHMGVPTGTDTANNALTIHNTKETVAGFRNAVSTHPVLHLSHGAQSVPSSGGVFSFQVVASGNWTWEKSLGSEWLSVSEANPQDGSQIFHYSVAANPLDSRTAAITVRSGDSSIVHHISQPGSGRKAALQKKLRNLRKQLRKARLRNQGAKVRRLNVQIRKLVSQLRRL